MAILPVALVFLSLLLPPAFYYLLLLYPVC